MSAVFRRKIYRDLISWKKNSHGTTAALIEGARRTGKTTVVKEFAKNEYKDYLLIDFSNVKPLTKKLFRDGLQGNVKGFLSKLQLSEGKVLSGDSVIIFDEVQKCLKAREMIKHLVADGSFDYIETGSLISLRKNTRDIMIPSEEYPIPMYPMDFEEYLWACGDEVTVPYLRECFRDGKPLEENLHAKVMCMYREYMAIGGMPQVVSAYLEERSIAAAERQKKSILKLYREEIRKMPNIQSIKTESLLDSVPILLSKSSKIFSPGDISENGRTRQYRGALEWLTEAKIVNKCVSTRDPSAALKLSLDDSLFKCYLMDTGLLISMAMGNAKEDYSAYRELMMGKLSVNKGMFFENMVAQELTANGYNLIFGVFNVEKDNRLREVDFLLSKKGLVVPIEVKSSYSKRHSSLDRFMATHKDLLEKSYVVHTGNYEVSGDVTYIPIYMAQFI